MGTIVQTWVQVCTLLQGVALLAVLGSLIVCALRLHFLARRTRPDAEVVEVEHSGWAA